jgi:hypothetical protein
MLAKQRVTSAGQINRTVLISLPRIRARPVVLADERRLATKDCLLNIFSPPKNLDAVTRRSPIIIFLFHNVFDHVRQAARISVFIRGVLLRVLCLSQWIVFD